MILVDTSAWVEYFRDTASAQDRLLGRLIDEGEDIAITGIVLTEILQGFRNEREFRKVRGFLLRLPLMEPGGAFTYLRAAALYRTCRARGVKLRKTVDCIIAATCIEHRATLLHRDEDFDRIAAVSALKVLTV